MESSSLTTLFSPLFLLLIISPFCSVTSSSSSNDLRLSSKALFPKLQAEKLIRELNLFPKESVNTRSSDDVLFSPGKIVEKKFTFPNLYSLSGQPSVEDLGHHAGYYRLPHSKAARYVKFFILI